MNAIFENLTIGGLADAARVNVETIRFYQRKGLVAEPSRPSGGIRRYGTSELARVRLIKSAQRLGISLDEVAELLRLDDGSHCNDARALAERKLQDVSERLANLRSIETALRQLIASCDAARGQVRQRGLFTDKFLIAPTCFAVW